jgi:hypothetical protein
MKIPPENNDLNPGRRLFLKLSAATCALGAGYGLLKWFTAEPEDIVIAILKRRVGFLDIEIETFTVFARDYVKSKSQQERKLTMLSMLSIPAEHISPYSLLPQGNPVRRLENNVVSQFLLSTDFFQHEANENRKIHYQGFYNPLVTICANPLMRMV